MKILINIGTNPSGGGSVHIIELLKRFENIDTKIKTIVLFAPKSFLDKLDNKSYLIKKSNFLLNGNVFYKFLWRFILSKYIINEKFDLIFSPFGDFYKKKYLCLSMSQNMLFFEKNETKGFPFFYRLKFYLMGKFQLINFHKSKNVIFLSKYASNIILGKKINLSNYRIINHGISEEFKLKPRIQKDYNDYTSNEKFKILFVSSIFPYKNLDVLLESFTSVIKEYPNIELIIIGEISIKNDEDKYLKLFTSDNLKNNITYKGFVPHTDIIKFYHTSDLFVFSSTCENMPNILIEAMSSGLPILCSNKEPMNEFILDGAIYYNAKDVNDTIHQLKIAISDTNLRTIKSQLSFDYSNKYSWNNCANNTFKYMEDLISVKKTKI